MSSIAVEAFHMAVLHVLQSTPGPDCFVTPDHVLICLLSALPVSQSGTLMLDHCCGVLRYNVVLSEGHETADCGNGGG